MTDDTKESMADIDLADYAQGLVDGDTSEAGRPTADTNRDPALASMLLFGDIFQDLPKLTNEHLRLLGIQIIVLLKTPLEERTDEA
ncbi:hypothetical protein LCGC14_0520440 [marine sediment metagenome]|uniref:Uncharacterized protein n=1 Tax=marine sediment metagenome TaxID=412755 RepID=A0A0F9UK48_9ZZZZ